VSRILPPPITIRKYNRATVFPGPSVLASIDPWGTIHRIGRGGLHGGERTCTRGPHGGESLRFDIATIGCTGGKRYLGFTKEAPPNFEHFRSCGIPGVLEGERYKKSPELVKEYETRSPSFTAPSRHIVFKRWDRVGDADAPQVAIFFASPDVLSGLFTPASFDEADLNAVYCPFCAGCGSIVKYPFLEKDALHPRAVLGMFDVSARPFVPGSTLSFAVLMNKFVAMIDNMDESFLTTRSWKAVRRRMG